MKKLVLTLSVLAVAAVSTGAQAMIAERINSLDLTANQVKEIIQEQGSAIVSTGPGIYARYVSGRGHCDIGQDTKAAFVPTADSSSAFVGYSCYVNHQKS